MYRYFIFAIWLFAAGMVTPAFAGDGFSLGQVIEKALSQSPSLKAFKSSIDAAKGQQKQAGLWANPEIGIDAENIAGSGAYKGSDSAEITYGISQELRIGGELSASRKIAGKELEIAELDYQSAALDLIMDVTSAYAEAVTAEENVRLATEQKSLASDVLKSVNTRVNAAAAPLIQKSRAEVESSASSIALDNAIIARDTALGKLAVLTGEPTVSFTLNSNDFYEADKIEVIGEEGLKNNPDIIKLQKGFEQSKEFLAYERAVAIPNPRINAGVRDLREDGEQAFIVGVSLPIAVFDTNRGNIDKARSQVSKTEFDNRQTELNAKAGFHQAKREMDSAYRQAQTLKAQILPSADNAFKLAREGYGLGRFPYMEVLDAQRSLFGVRQQHIEALKEFHIAKARVERFTALHISMIEKGEGDEK